MAIKSKTQLKQDRQNTIYDNNNAEIEASKHAALIDDIIDSTFSLISNSGDVGLSPHDQSKAYSEGDHVEKDNAIYEANKSISAGTAFSEADWDHRAGAAVNKAIDTTDSIYSVKLYDHIILVDASSGSVQLDLPSAVNANNHEFVVVAKDATNDITINTTDTINGSGSDRKLNAPYEVMRLACDGTEYYITDNFTTEPFKTISSDYTTNGERTILANASGGSIIVTISTQDILASNGRLMTILTTNNDETNTVKVVTEAGEPINGGTVSEVETFVTGNTIGLVLDSTQSVITNNFWEYDRASLANFDETKDWLVSVSEMLLRTSTITSSLTTAGDDTGIFPVDTSSGAVTVTLASAAISKANTTSSDYTAARPFIIHDIGGRAHENPITIATEGGETINGKTTIEINQKHGAVRLYSDGSNLFTIGEDSDGSVYSQYATQTVSGATTGSLISSSIKGDNTLPAYNLSQQGRVIKIRLKGPVTISSGETINIKVSLGGTLICETGALSIGAISGVGFDIDVDLQVQSKTGDIFGIGRFTFHNSGGDLRSHELSSGTTVDIDETTTQEIQVEATLSGSSDSITSVTNYATEI